jgi:hypothetical protein
MARSRLTSTSVDIVTDVGAVLWSMVLGEALEFPITLNFITDATQKTAGLNYLYEAVVVEAKNITGQQDFPTVIQPSGKTTTLFVRQPRFIGTWNTSTAYNKEEIVVHNNIYYKLIQGVSVTTTINPATDTARWTPTVLNKIYVQFPSTLGSDWAIKPLADSAVYGFFELRVTEPSDPVFTRTFKPVRGLVELLFSPTSDTADTSGKQSVS